MKIELCHVRITRSRYIDYVKQFVAECQRDYSVYTTDEDKARAMAIADYEAAFGSTTDTDEEYAYLAGAIAKRMYGVAKMFMCDCCRKKR